MTTDTAERNHRKTIEGIVVSDKTDKTRVIQVTRRVRHPFYEKIMTKRAKFYAHDEANESHQGDLVEIASTRPISKLKRWRIVKVVKAAPRLAAAAAAVEKKLNEPEAAE